MGNSVGNVVDVARVGLAGEATRVLEVAVGVAHQWEVRRANGCALRVVARVAVDAHDCAQLATLLPVAARVVDTGCRTGDVVDVAHMGCADEVVHAAGR